tara:strand:- start:10095 stop:11252 length:1158 start_codon:yes stop_codon:yes gene_type:complete
MIIEIRQAGFKNKGAELMLHSVVEKLRNRYPDVKLTMAPTYGGTEDTFEKMRKLQLYPKLWVYRYGFDFSIFANLLPKSFLNKYGIVLNSEVDIVIDAAGFSYSDQWGVGSSKELAISSSKWKKQSKKIILLPQAFGPYNTENIKKYVSTWANNCDLIFAREQDSYAYLTDIAGEQNKIKLYPDFTNLIKGTLPENYDPSERRVAIVPNYRMIDKTNKEESEAYLPFMIKCAKYMLAKNAKPFILVHEGIDDQLLAEKISNQAGGIEILVETDPLHIKGILGSCDATIGSRFHGLVSALSQGVPSLATGWSHKYLRLFEDYQFTEGLVSVLDTDSALSKKIDLLIDPDSRKEIVSNLQSRSKILKAKSEEMWETVFNEIDNYNSR